MKQQPPQNAHQKEMAKQKQQLPPSTNDATKAEHDADAKNVGKDVQTHEPDGDEK
jgi:hypothetical protein